MTCSMLLKRWKCWTLGHKKALSFQITCRYSCCSSRTAELRSRGWRGRAKLQIDWQLAWKAWRCEFIKAYRSLDKPKTWHRVSNTSQLLACHQALCFTCYPAVEGILLVAFVHICPQSVHTCVALLQVDVLNQGYGVDVEEDSHDRELDDAPNWENHPT